ncbi:MAG: AraC family transcriptional regulator [Ruminococcaceae bacterium]|nr:AraC family transcriptional regulator [Oscillospiraceae bacterium]
MVFGDYMDYIISYNGLVYNHTKSEIPNEKEFASHTHNKYEILYFMSGEVDCIIGNMRRTLSPGEMVLIPSLYVHHIEIMGNKPYERIVLNFDRSGADEKLLKKVFSSPKIIDTKAFPYIAGVFDRFKKYSKIFADNERQILFYSILTELIYLAFNALNTDSGAVTFDGYSTAARKAINYVNKNLFEITDIDDICRSLFISKAYLHRVFLNSLGMSPMKYLKSKRLIVAREMIRLGEKPTSVARKVCYNDYTTFFRAYKSYFGYSPIDTELKK